MRILVVLAWCLAFAPAAEKQSFQIQSSKIAWKAMELPGVPSGLEQRLLHENKPKGLFSALVKFPKGFREPRHYHTTCGHSMYILKGRIQSPEGDLTPGTFIYAAVNERHGPFTALEESEFLFYNDGPFDFHVEDTKTPRPK
jgi:quercetin dioxygenase-like cupin family protein